MTHTQSLMRTNQYYINDDIYIYIPTLGEIYDFGESEYYRVAQLLTSVPYDLMVQFDDMGMDYEDITEYQLFLMLLQSFVDSKQDISIVLGGLDIQKLRIAENIQTNEKVMLNESGECVIDRAIQIKIANAIRKIHFWEKNERKAGNAEAKKYLIERNRLKQKRAKRKPVPSFLDESIVKLVNTEEFKYNYEQCMDLSIYKFNASLHQIPKKKNWEQTITGAYFGTVDLNKLNIEKIHWMSSIG